MPLLYPHLTFAARFYEVSGLYHYIDSQLTLSEPSVKHKSGGGEIVSQGWMQDSSLLRWQAHEAKHCRIIPQQITTAC